MIVVMLTGQSGKGCIIICGRKGEEPKEIFSIFRVVSRISSQKVKVGEFKRLKCLGCTSGLLGTLRTCHLFSLPMGIFLVRVIPN